MLQNTVLSTASSLNITFNDGKEKAYYANEPVNGLITLSHCHVICILHTHLHIVYGHLHTDKSY